MRHSYTVSQLQAALASSTAPQLLDVRRAPVFEQADELIAGAFWRDPEQIADWSGGLDSQRPVVVYCVHGHQVSQGCARQLADLGFDAAFLEGGIEAWRAAAGPMAAKSGTSA